MNDNKLENKVVHVTMPTLAPLNEYINILEEIWERGILTHNGPVLQAFEKQLMENLGLQRIAVVSNGTVALQIAIKALNLKGEIITTPFTWVATASAIIWEGCTPVFADIDSKTLNIDPLKIKEKITDKTCAIMPVHVFGNPCDTRAIEEIANQHHLKVIYDAAHAVGSTLNAKSLLEYGHISTTSFHATKLLNTAEGGACITNDEELYEKVKRIRFFGHNEQKDIIEDGFNGKMSEVNAALGIVNLKYLDMVLKDRKSKYLYYLELLSQIEGLQFQKLTEGANYSYFPVIFKSEDLLLTVENRLNKNNVFPRRYFYPSINMLNHIISYSQASVAEDISRRVLCLPLHMQLTDEVIKRICKIVGEQL